MAEFPTYEQMAKNVAEKALDEFLYNGKSIREWMKIIAEQEPKADILDKIKADIEMYEADCRLQGGTKECEICNANVFGSIYRIIDKYR